MPPCLNIAQSKSDICCWGRRPTIPILLESFCDFHNPFFLQYVIYSYFTHHVKIGLFVSTPDAFYVFLMKDEDYFFAYAWSSKPLAFFNDQRPLHFKKTVSGLVTRKTTIEILLSLPVFEMSALLLTSLVSVAVLPHVPVDLRVLSVKNITFNPLVPAFTIPSTDCVPVDVLSSPFVMLMNGSTTPDPRLYKSGTCSLWKTMVKDQFSIQKLRCGLFLRQKKTLDFIKSVSDESGNERKDNYEQFVFEL
jgi:hypothetical protein